MSIRSIITKGLGGLARWLVKARFDLADNDGTPPVIPPQIPGNGIFTTAYSPLITGGLGTSACCGLLLGGMGAWQCFVGITPPPTGGAGGGGGSYAIHPGIYVPWPKAQLRKKNTRAIVVTVRIKEKKWTKSYLIPEKRAKIAVQAIHFINKTTAALSVGVSSVHRAARKVTAVFNKE
jgi:hypothetical protein